MRCCHWMREATRARNLWCTKYGTKNLRVEGASIFSLSTRGSCQTTANAVAEKAAGLIQSDNGIHV